MISTTFRSTTTRAAMLACLLTFTFVGSAAAQDCVVFAGLEHCATGEASLELGEQGLSMHNLGNAGTDGVKIDVGHAIGWKARTDFDSPSGGAIHLGAISDGAVVSTATIKASRDGLSFGSTFTGAGKGTTFSVKVYRDGELQGGQGGLTANRIIIGYNISIDEYMDWLQWAGFYLRMADGSCSWELEGDRDRPLALRLPNGDEVVGDEIRLVEEIRGGGNYPYVGFQGITVQAEADCCGHIGEEVVIDLD